jgi:hypothetical protein
MTSVLRFLKRFLVGNKRPGAAAALRNAVSWIFIALVALFLTHPSGGPYSAYGMQVPWPAELGLEGGLGMPGTKGP